MIGLELVVISDAAHRTELLQTLGDLTLEVAGRGGCQECRVFEDATGSDRYLWTQWWKTQQQMEEHLQSPMFRTLLGAIKVLGTLESARTVELQDSTSLMGAFLSTRSNVTGQPSEN